MFLLGVGYPVGTLVDCPWWLISNLSGEIEATLIYVGNYSTTWTWTGTYYLASYVFVYLTLLNLIFFFIVIFAYFFHYLSLSISCKCIAGLGLRHYTTSNFLYPFFPHIKLLLFQVLSFTVSISWSLQIKISS